jgi:hypothetical protein
VKDPESFMETARALFDESKGTFYPNSPDVLSSIAVGAKNLDVANREEIMRMLITSSAVTGGLPRRALAFIAAERIRQKNLRRAEEIRKRDRGEE